MGRRAIVLLVALILAGLAGWAVWNYLESVQEEHQAGQEIVTVFRAGPSGIAEGQEGSILLSGFNSDVRCQNDASDAATTQGCGIRASRDQLQDTPADAFTSVETLRQYLDGRIAAGPVSAGSILTRAQWVELSLQTTPLADLIPAGKQAMTIQVGQVEGVNGFIEPGDLINMIITLDIPASLIPLDFPGVVVPEDPSGEFVPGGDPLAVMSFTRFVLQGIPVMAVGTTVRVDEDGDQTGQIPAVPTTTPEGEAPAGPGGNATTFTLEVTPEQAERIAHAFANGNIWLTLVPADFVEVNTQGVILNNLFGGNLIEDIFENFGN